jgi:hypothetical protein
VLGQGEGPQPEARLLQQGQQVAQQWQGVLVDGGGRQAIGQDDGHVAGARRLFGQPGPGLLVELAAPVGPLQVFRPRLAWLRTWHTGSCSAGNSASRRGVSRVEYTASRACAWASLKAKDSRRGTLVPVRPRAMRAAV